MNPAYVEAAVARERAKLAGTTSGRNNQLNETSFALGQFISPGELDRTRAEEVLLSACQENGYIAKAGAARARATIRSGLDAGYVAATRHSKWRGRNHEIGTTAVSPN